jgi:hypothetical protein
LTFLRVSCIHQILASEEKNAFLFYGGGWGQGLEKRGKILDMYFLGGK